MPASTTLYVCATCRPADHDDAQPRPGARLAAEVAALAEASGGEVAVKAVQCLSVCKRPCAVAVSGPDKFTYVVGDAEPGVHAQDLVDFAMAHTASADGVTVWRERPQIVRKSVIARIPSLGQASSLVGGPDMSLLDSTDVPSPNVG